MRRPVCLALSVVTLLLGAGVAQAQPGPYPLWTFPTPERTGAPAWYKDMVYVMPFQFSEGGTLADMLYAINATTGQQVFAIPFTPLLNNNTGDWKGMAPAVTEVNVAKAGEPVDNRIVVLYGFHGSYTVYAIDGLTGEALWERRTWPPGCGGLYCEITGFSSPVGGVFVVEQPSFLVSLDARNGHVNWNTSVYDNDGNPGSWRSHVAPYNSGSFIWSTRDYVHRVEIATGGYLWSSQYVEPHCGGMSCAVTAYDPPVVVGDMVYVSGYVVSATNGNGGVIMAMYALTGSVKWSAMPSNFSGWVGANRNIAVMEDGENNAAPINGLYSYNSTTGKLLWHMNWNTSTYASAVMVDPKSNNVAFALNDEAQTLYVYDGVTGALVGSMASGIHEQFAFAPHGSSFAASLSQSGTPGVTAIYIGSG